MYLYACSGRVVNNGLLLRRLFKRKWNSHYESMAIYTKRNNMQMIMLLFLSHQIAVHIQRVFGKSVNK